METSRNTYRRLYRAADHGFIEQQCRSGEVRSHSPALQAFAAGFIAQKNLREKADYDGLEQIDITEVRTALEFIESLLAQFAAQPLAARRAFSVYVILKLATRA